MNAGASAMDRLRAFLKDGIWRLKTEDLPAAKVFVIKTVKLLLLSWRGFHVDICPLRASALTLYTLLSIVPVFAMLFGIAKGFGMENLLRDRLLEQFRDQQAVALKLIDFAQSLLAKTQGGLVAGIGIAVLFWSVMSVIGEIEKSFNHIWKIGHDRPLGRKVSDYLSLMLLAPVLLIVSSSISVYVQSRITGLVAAVALPTCGSDLVLQVFGYLPLIIVWLLFTVTLIFMPNTKVAYKSGVFAGVIAGTAYQLTQWTYIRLMIGVSNYNAVYGSFAALPLFIVWLQIGWLILLFGAEMAFYHQHFESYSLKNEISAGSFALKKIAALRIVHLLVHKFAAAEPPLNADEIAQTLHLPAEMVHTIITELLDTRILAEVQSDAEKHRAYQPARDIGLLRVATIIEALENYSAASLQPESDDIGRFNEIAEQFGETIKNSPANFLLKDI
jgi:membrane protein